MRQEGQRYIVKRYIVEHYDVIANSREEAEVNALNPYQVDCTRITVNKIKG